MISLKGVNKSYGNLEVLKDLNLEIKKGEVVALVGPSGCGKSTLLKCITGLESQYQGKIFIDGLEQSEYLNRERIAVVLQKYSNFEWMTVTENIHSAFLNFDYEGHNKIIESLLIETGLIGFEQSHINELSGGMQQRVAVARALAQHTKVLAFDEPFGSLDIENRRLLQKLFRKQVLNKDLTAVFITHDIEEAILISDRVVVLNKIPSSIRKIFETSNVNLEESRYSEEFTNLKMKIENELNN